jgi:hypothetical protein
LLEQDCFDEAGDRGLVGKMLATFVRRFTSRLMRSCGLVERIWLQWPLWNEVYVEHVVLRLLHQRGDPREALAQVICDGAPLCMCVILRLLSECGADGCRNHTALVLNVARALLMK